MNFLINEVTYTVADNDVPQSLLNLLDYLGLTGTRFGCGTGLCGCCTVIIDGAAIRACVTPAADTAHKEIRTIEGLATNHNDHTITLHPVQQAFLDEQVPQCGYCMSGQIMAAVALLEQNPQPTEQEIKEAMADNLCRCGMYARILKAIKRVIAKT